MKTLLAALFLLGSVSSAHATLIFENKLSYSFPKLDFSKHEDTKHDDTMENGCKSCLSIKNESSIKIKDYSGEPVKYTGLETKGSFGSLVANHAGTFSATYLGQDSAYVNSFAFTGGASLKETDAIGKTIFTSANAGLLGFSFSDDHGATFTNGSNQGKTLGFAFLDPSQFNAKYGKEYGNFDTIIGFNDSAKGDADYDDFVIGIRFNCDPVTPSVVPEPETYAMMLAGLGFIGFAARRRRNTK